MKSLASWLLEVVCAVETPVERMTALLPISVTVPLNFCFGMASMDDLGRLPELHVDDVGLVHFNLGGDHRGVGDRHQRAARRVLDTDDDGFAFAHRKVGDDAVEGRPVFGLAEHIGQRGGDWRRSA